MTTSMPTPEQWAQITRDLELARGRAVSGEDGWDAFYSPFADRIRIMCAELGARGLALVPRDLMAMTEGG